MSSNVLIRVGSSSWLSRSLSGTRRVPTKGLGVSDGLEWKISSVRNESWRGRLRGSVNRSFQTGRVDPASSDLVASLLSGSTQNTAYGLRSPFFQLTFFKCLAETIVSSRSRGFGSEGRDEAILGGVCANLRLGLKVGRIFYVR